MEKYNEKVRLLYTNFYERENTETESKKSSKIQIIYDGLAADEESAKIAKLAFYEFMRKYENDDIVEVAEKIKEIFKDIIEEELSIYIESKDKPKFQSVKYKNGLISEYDFRLMVDYYVDGCKDADIICINMNSNGTKIRVEQNEKYIKNMDDLYAVNEQLGPIFKKIFDLHKLETPTRLIEQKTSKR